MDTGTQAASPQQVARFLLDLSWRFKAAQEVERELDRHLARRFNVFRYLRKDELGLSQIIADLLDPTAEHGQGTSFLEALLATLPQNRTAVNACGATPSNPIRVQRERLTTTGGRIDITVDIPDGDRSFCLAFENKPYAADLAGQMRAYLEYLTAQYKSHFLLVYLPPTPADEPSEASLSKEDRARFRGHYAVMPYAGKHSLADWLANCRSRCDAERMRWFLREAESYFRSRFGEPTMTTDTVTDMVRDYLSSNPSQLRTALAVHNAWRRVRADICKRFLEHLRRAVEDRMHKELSDVAPDLHVRCRYGGDKPHSNKLWITHDSWVTYGDSTGDSTPRRTAIQFRSESKGPNGWIWGISQPKDPKEMTGAEKVRRERLEEALKKREVRLAHDGMVWPQYETPKRYANWDPLVPDLHEECEKGGGKITDYLADKLLDIAAQAVPAINEVEGSAANPQR